MTFSNNPKPFLVVEIFPLATGAGCFSYMPTSGRCRLLAQLVSSGPNIVLSFGGCWIICCVVTAAAGLSFFCCFFRVRTNRFLDTLRCCRLSDGSTTPREGHAAAVFQADEDGLRRR